MIVSEIKQTPEHWKKCVLVLLLNRYCCRTVMFWILLYCTDQLDHLKQDSRIIRIKYCTGQSDGGEAWGNSKATPCIFKQYALRWWKWTYEMPHSIIIKYNFSAFRLSFHFKVLGQGREQSRSLGRPLIFLIFFGFLDMAFFLDISHFFLPSSDDFSWSQDFDDGLCLWSFLPLPGALLGSSPFCFKWH